MGCPEDIRFSRGNFCDWFRKRGKARRTGPMVMLYPDYLNDYFFPETLADTSEVLRMWGFRVILPPKRPAALRPLIHYGMLDLAKREMLRNVRMLTPYARSGIPIIHLEPSELSAYWDEYQGLFPNDRDGQRVKDVSMLLGDMIIKRNLKVPRLEGNAVFHGHCHQKAVLDIGAARKVLGKMGLKFEEPQPGCCGMAGSFGFEADSYHISKRISEERLLPAVRKADKKTYIVADGFSCRSQIIDGTGRRPYHLAELVRHAFDLRQFRIVRLGRQSRRQCPKCGQRFEEKETRVAAKRI